MLMIKQTCESVTEVTIRNCFRKAHIMTADAEPDYQITFPSEIPITNIDEYVECDCGWECCVKLAIDEIVEDICKNNSDFNANKSTDNEFTTTIITHKEAVAALVIIQSYFHENNIKLANLDEIEEHLVRLVPQTIIQTYIFDYFI
ncbi:hypothetical protein T4B_5608 [Trichinella pseudospiralis]|uniref:Uncharacterized protein n=1 Tax=Trichinella pseudospiralis TaxID=6337 RepID=A0A0V1JYY5_TRIPS|nr:hypothetical protein T4A_10731 [Trichinella pseudospiralis]KRZ25199.1 hypothetical protein T4B_5608 [Trichinella pseudospiralis]KRZ40193.1 hypothetical protein T4C_9454 [Trichinella pseudospiralis]